MTTMQVTDCAVVAPELASMMLPDLYQESSAQMPIAHGLNANGFSFTTWNIKKGKTDGWHADFEKICRNMDIIILQEAYLTDNLKEVLRQQKLQWDLSAAYAYQQIEAGVLTASKIAPNLTCTLKVKEPITRIPKSILITRYPISGNPQGLLVANIHGINFTLGYKAFQTQCDRLESLLAVHRGPMIVSGDFNTWNQGRMSRVEAMAQRLNLSAVPFRENVKTKFFGQYVDHVYYRGLETINKTTFNVATSDHNPLSVVFKVVEGSERQGS
jgi:endonuclease/exonuclease/phosphatase (EEP) superfamily protein YafD